MVWSRLPPAYSMAPAVIFFKGKYTVLVNTKRMIRDRKKIMAAVMYTIFRIWFWLSRIRSMGMWSTT